MTNQLGEILGQTISNQQDMQSSLVQPGSINTYFLFGMYRIKARTTRCKVESRTIGTAFILGHASNAVLGTSTLGAGTMSGWSEVETIYTTQELTSAGKESIRDWLYAGTETEPQYLAVGTDNTAFNLDDTTLGAELDRVGTARRTTDITNDKKAILTWEVKSTDSSIIGNTAKEIGLLNASSNGDLMCRYVITDLAMVNTKEYRFTIDIELEDVSEGQSLVPTAGLNQIRNWLGAGTANDPTYMAWGTGTTVPAAVDTTLEGEQQRNAFSTERNHLSFTYIHTGILEEDEANAQTITKSGIFNAAAAGTLMGETKFAPIPKTASFRIQEEDYFTIV